MPKTKGFDDALLRARAQGEGYARVLHADKDFALMGFDDVLDAAHSNPPVSTVDTRPTELGERAPQMLLARIADPGRAKQKYLATPRLVIRQSA